MAAMSNDHPRKNETGEPTANGGEFAHKAHDEDAGIQLNHTGQVRIQLEAELMFDPLDLPELPEFPADFPEPTISVERSGDDDHIEVTFLVGEDSYVMWQGSDGDKYNTLTQNFGANQSRWDAKTTESLIEWSEAVYDRAGILAFTASSPAFTGEPSRVIADLAVGRAYTPADPVGAHLRAVSGQAGLGGIMPEVLSVLRDRETIPDEKLKTLTADDVTRYYFDLIGPALDRMESDLEGE